MIKTIFLSTLVALSLWATGSPVMARAAENNDAVAARVDDWIITRSKLDQALQGPFYDLDRKRHDLRMAKIQEMMAEHLLKLEVAARKISMDQLEAEINAKAEKPTDQKLDEFIAKNSQRLPKDDPQLRDKLRDFMTERAREQVQARFIAELAQKYRAEILLEAPQAPRFAVQGATTPTKGPSDAKVTIVEFSDFQCTYCRRVQETLKQLDKLYAGKIRVIYRHYPLSFHPQAAKAAEAAQCADEQGQFWSYHDALFGSESLDLATLKKLAATVTGIHVARFDQCLSEERHKGRVIADVAEGERLGVSGTPTFFVNGIKLVGAVPLEEIREVIDAELKR
ncbi:MAG: thioredoxin domain-containing protein [Magnetococcales bacterium]|nr:thioredoxin domain-containing protein [Magnetococcales bacterium]